MPDVANIKANAWKVTIGGSEAEMSATVTLGGGYRLKAVTTQKTAEDIVARLVTGRYAELTFEFQEDTADVQLRALGLGAAGDALDVGAQLPTTTVLLHPAQLPDGTETHDLFFYAVSFGVLERTTNGQGEAIWKLPAVAQRDSNGKIVRQGVSA